jgi:hypothetical protein
MAHTCRYKIKSRSILYDIPTRTLNILEAVEMFQEQFRLMEKQRGGGGKLKN